MKYESKIFILIT